MLILPAFRKTKALALAALIITLILQLDKVLLLSLIKYLHLFIVKREVFQYCLRWRPAAKKNTFRFSIIPCNLKSS